MSKEQDARLVEFDTRMANAVAALLKEFSGIRTGRASVSLLDPIRVDAYGSLVPLQQVATVSSPDPRQLVVQVWDKGMAKTVEKAIRDADLGLNPSLDGALVRVPMPMLTEERRQELAKVAAKYSEEAKVAVRNVRRDGMDSLKRQEKDSEITEDDLHRLSEGLQTLTDTHIKAIDEALAKKQKDILSL